MSLSGCEVETDEKGRELAQHGAVGFPLACYDEDFAHHLVPWHWHDEFELVLITRGEAHILVESQNILLKEGEALLINLGALHSVNGGKPEGALCHSLVFHPRLIGGSIDSVFWQKLVLPFLEHPRLRAFLLKPSVSWQAKVISGWAQAWETVNEEPLQYELTVRDLLSRTFWILAEHLPLQDRCVSQKEALAAGRTKLMMQYIQAHYTEELTLRQIADSAAVSESVCLRSFRQVIGTTPIQYVLCCRIEKAAALLRTTPYQVREIAIASGFSDFSYFTKCFRKFKNCTPLEYRCHCR